MTPQQQIAYLRTLDFPRGTRDALAPVCSLAERALLTDDEAEAVRWDMEGHGGACMTSTVRGILRRLLPDVPAEHRLVRFIDSEPRPEVQAQCSCGWWGPLDPLDAAVRAWAAHAGIGHD